MAYHVFVGPTLPRQSVVRQLPTATIHPPIRHGDLLRCRIRSGDVAIIIDGYYHQQEPIRHKEILSVLSDGVTVIGTASMGALRAAELSAFGMIGMGTVYKMYQDGLIDGDDEVAVAHSNDENEFRVLGVPLINVRYALSESVRAGAISRPQADSVLELARSQYYSTRSWESLLRTADSPTADAIRIVRAVGDQNNWLDVKRNDAESTLNCVRQGNIPSRSPVWPGDTELDTWRTQELRSWEAIYDPTRAVGGVGAARLMAFRQLFDSRFSLEWRRFVLERFACAEPRRRLDFESEALHRARKIGTWITEIPFQTTLYWITEYERAHLTEEEQTLRVLVRSNPLRPDLVGEVLDTTDFSDRARTAIAVKVCDSVNDNFTNRYDRTIDQIRTDVIAKQIAKRWSLIDYDSTGSWESLDAAARDRGFADAAAAIGAARHFTLAWLHPIQSNALALKYACKQGLLWRFPWFR